MNALALPQLKSFSKWAPLILRLGVGITMAAHGWSKLQGGSEGWLSGGMLTNMAGFPAGAAVPLAWLVLAVELVGGLFVLFGLFTRLSALLIAAVMIVAIVTVKFAGGFIGSYELDFVILTSALAIAVLGSGELGLDKVLGWESND